MLMRKMFKVVRLSIDELAHLNAFEISKDTIPRKIETLAFFRLSECVFHVVCVCVCFLSLIQNQCAGICIIRSSAKANKYNANQ